MQYQIYKDSTGEIIAWIDVFSSEQVLKKGYSIIAGKDLRAEESISDDDFIRAVGQFEKVTWGQWCSAMHYDPCAVFTNHSSSVEYDSIKLPKRATKDSAGYDFFLPFNVTLKVGETINVPTGIKCRIKRGYVLKEYPRSSLGFKYRLRLNNTVGIIDSDYYGNENNEGHIFIKMTNEGDKTIILDKGEAFCQGIFEQFFITDDDEVSDKRVGGIGSTNK